MPKDDELYEEHIEGSEHEDKEEKPEDSSQESSEGLEELRRNLNQAVQTTQSNAQAISEMRELLREFYQQGSSAKDKEDEPRKPEEPQNIEMLDRKEFADYILKQARKLFEDEVKPVREKTDNVSQEAQQERLARQAEQLRGLHKDFDDWQDEMKKLYQETGMLDLKRLYNLARSENPDKAAKLDKKYTPERKESKEKSEGSEPFGGYAPSSSKLEKAKEEGLTGQQAADKAWEIVMGKSEE